MGTNERFRSQFGGSFGRSRNSPLLVRANANAKAHGEENLADRRSRSIPPKSGGRWFIPKLRGPGAEKKMGAF
eukprot:scaffold37464_cov31-Tisochrysis_lutea.AAC.5